MSYFKKRIAASFIFYIYSVSTGKTQPYELCTPSGHMFEFDKWTVSVFFQGCYWQLRFTNLLLQLISVINYYRKRKLINANVAIILYKGVAVFAYLCLLVLVFLSAGLQRDDAVQMFKSLDGSRFSSSFSTANSNLFRALVFTHSASSVSQRFTAHFSGMLFMYSSIMSKEISFLVCAH